jgi:serine/threonine protein kinase
MSDSFEGLPNGYQILEYELKEVLGQGGFGITYLAIDLNLNKKVAIKEYFPREFSARNEGNTIRPIGSQADRDTFAWGLKRFLEEARTLALFENPNIVSVKRFFEANGTAYLVMEYCDGQSLDEIIKNEGPLTEGRILKILEPLLDGLENIHSANFLHRDVKPANIFIREDGSPVLLDFGSARKHLSSHSKTVTSLATVGYAPVEQYSSSGMQGPPVDIYGLAATLYRAITGERPQDALDRVLNDDLIPLVKRDDINISKKLLAAIDRGMAVRPENRPQTIAEWRSELNLSVGDELKARSYEPAILGNKQPFVLGKGNTSASSLLKYGAFFCIFLVVIGAFAYLSFTSNKASSIDSQTAIKSTPIPQPIASKEPNLPEKSRPKVPETPQSKLPESIKPKAQEPINPTEKRFVGAIYQVNSWGGGVILISVSAHLRDLDIVYTDDGDRFQIQGINDRYANIKRISGNTAMHEGDSVYLGISSNQNPVGDKKDFATNNSRQLVGYISTDPKDLNDFVVKVELAPGVTYVPSDAVLSVNGIKFLVTIQGRKYLYISREDNRSLNESILGKNVYRSY